MIDLLLLATMSLSFDYFFMFLFHFATFFIQLDNSSSRFQISSKSIPTLSVFLTHLCYPLSSFISALTLSFFIVFPLQKFLLPSDFSGIFSGMPRGKHLIETQKDRIYSDVCKDHTVEHIFSLLLLFSHLSHSRVLFYDTTFTINAPLSCLFFSILF